jgi:fumarate hydratase class I
MALNADGAQRRCQMICQDTGLPLFVIKAPVGADQLLMSQWIGDAVAGLSRAGLLRANAVDGLSGRARPDNRGPGTPRILFEQWLSDDLEVRVLLRGGACENESRQYTLPCELPPFGPLERDLDGVKRCVWHAVHSAQGRACAPGIVGVAVGGDRASGCEEAILQLLRPLDDTHPDPRLWALEAEIVEGANALGVGSLGLGGRVTLSGCKIALLDHLPSSYLVSVAYNCWALRRAGALLDGDTGGIKRRLYEPSGGPASPVAQPLPRSGREKRLTIPISEEQARALHVGDVVLLSGVIHTGRSTVHHYLANHDSPLPLRGGVLYHCSPLATRQGSEWVVSAAGPETSRTEEGYVPDLIRAFGLRAVMGRGGMGAATLQALRECGAVYLSAVGGAAELYARHVERVEGVDLLAFGPAQASWRLRVREFPAIVSMDSHGRSLHEEVEQASARELLRLAGEHTRVAGFSNTASGGRA